MSLHAPSPCPLPPGERGLHKFPPPSMGGAEGEGEYFNLLNPFAIKTKRTKSRTNVTIKDNSWSKLQFNNLQFDSTSK